MRIKRIKTSFLMKYSLQLMFDFRGGEAVVILFWQRSSTTSPLLFTANSEVSKICLSVKFCTIHIFPFLFFVYLQIQANYVTYISALC